MIEDKELRSLFKAESDEHLQGLEDSVLELEKSPGDGTIRNDAMRHAHSLKGAARMLGLKDIEHLAHRLGDLFRETDDAPALDPGRFDVIFRAIDGLKALCRQAITGKKTDADADALIEAIDTGHPPPAEKPESPPAPEATEPRGPTPDPGTPEEAVGEKSLPPDTSIETIRVHTQDLDRLLTDAGELTVARHRLHHHVEGLEALAEMPAAIAASLGSLREDALQQADPEAEASITDLTEHCRAELAALGQRLAEASRRLSEDHSRLEMVNQALESRINDVRMLPLSTLFGLFPRTVRDLARAGNKQVRLVTQGDDTTADKRVIEGLKDPIMHLVRNAVDHGIEPPEQRRQQGKEETGTIVLRGYQTPSRVVIEVLDDGRGLDRKKIREKAIETGLDADGESGMTDERLGEIIARPGFSTAETVTEVSGRGVGLDVVRRGVNDLKGQLEISSRAREGSRIKMTLPISLATTNVVLLALADQRFALPTETIVTTGRAALDEIVPVGGRMSLNVEGEAVPVVDLGEVLGIPRDAPAEPSWLQNHVILAVGDRRAVLLVDDVLEEQQVIIKPPGAFIRHLSCISGACILRSGDIAMVLRAADLMDSPERHVTESALAATETTPEPETVLLAEDSAVTRIQEKRILENAGYRVVMAVDGQEALEKLEHADADMIVTDITMPRLDGLALTERIRRHPRHHELPVILMTMLDREADKQRGLEAGADAYLMKSSFDQHELLETIRRLL